MKNLTHLLLLAGFLTIGPVYGQNTAFTYQGRVNVSGAAFTGIGQFKFALVTGTNTSRQATATANPPSGGFITLINVTYGGSGYPAAPAVTITGGGGAGATATAVVSGGSVTGITVNNPGSGYTGIPTVIVAPPPVNIAYTTHWSNDGTSANGSEPAAAVNLSVSGGLFTVVLGDTALANMAFISAGLFSQRDLQLRIWFSDGASGFLALNPPQNLTPAPSAVFANSASNLLGSLSTAQLTGSLPVSQLSGTLSLAQLPGAVLTNNEGSVTLSGAFSGNGSALTNIPLAGVNSAGTLSLVTNGMNFILSSTVAAGSSPWSAVAIDVNGDGKVDMICANRTSPGTLTVLTNNGVGSFGYYATLNVGDSPIMVVASDRVRCRKIRKPAFRGFF